MAASLDIALNKLPPFCPEAFDHAMIRGGLEACLVYVSWRKVLIRPFVPSTFENHAFEQAEQRVYLSATLGHGGELERAFGRTPITRLALPEDSSRPRNGRRFVVFTDLLDGDGKAITRQIVQEAGKALVLAPTDRLAGDAAAADGLTEIPH
jgi:hypothetical protein